MVIEKICCGNWNGIRINKIGIVDCDGDGGGGELVGIELNNI